MAICQVYMFYIIVLEMVNWTYNLVKFLKLAIIHAVNCSKKFLDRTGLPLQKIRFFVYLFMTDAQNLLHVYK